MLAAWRRRHQFLTGALLLLGAARGLQEVVRRRRAWYRGPLRDLLADPRVWPDDRHVQVEVTLVNPPRDCPA